MTEFDKVMQAKKSGYDEGRIMGLEEAAQRVNDLASDLHNWEIANIIRELKMKVAP